jgi:hypothetical protein
MELHKEQLQPKEAIAVLIKAAEIGQSKGAYTLQDASIIAKAIELFTVPPTQEEQKNEQTT